MDLNFSRIGFGSYRTGYKIVEHFNSLYKALTMGISLIDTSANYFDGGSELLIGKVLEKLFSEKKIKRDQIIIVTKGGYIQGENYKIALKKKEDGVPFSEVVEFSDRLWHCTSPDFLADQLERQLDRLKLDYVDVYLLHNPEYYLQWAKENNVTLDDAREIYYQRIRKAFEFLEQKVSEGKIKYYGISSNTFAGYSSDFDFTSLEQVLDIANSIKKDNHFKVIQLPFNLLEAGAVTIKNQINNTETVLELAVKAGIKVLVNRPLNAIAAKGLVRLADFSHEPFEEKNFIKQLKLMVLLEEDFLEEKLPQENLSEEELKNIKKHVTIGQIMERDWKFFGSIEHFNDVMQQIFVPKIDYMLRFGESKLENQNNKDFLNNYINQSYVLLNFVSNYYKLRAEKRSLFIHGIINKYIPEHFKDLTLSQKTLLLLSSTPGVSCVLVGMRKEKYVEDVFKIQSMEMIENASGIIRQVSNELNVQDL